MGGGEGVPTRDNFVHAFPTRLWGCDPYYSSFQRMRCVLCCVVLCWSEQCNGEGMEGGEGRLP